MAKEKKSLGLDSQGIQKTLRFRNYLGDGMGMFALNGMSGLVAMLTYFYTDKVGIAAAAAGTIILAARIFDAVTDLGMGYIMDHTKSRWGKARPWILWMAVPAFVFTASLFMVPSGASSGVKNAYAFVSNMLLISVVYTAIAIPFVSLLYFVTKSNEERTKMGLSRALIGYIIGMIIAIGLIPITNALGGDQRAWITVGIIAGLIYMGALLLAFSSVKEQVSSNTGEDTEKTAPFFKAIKLLFQNKYWILMLFVNFLISISYALGGATGIYYTKWILQNENLVAVMGGVGLIPTIIGFVITQPLVKKFGPAKTVRIVLLIGTAGALVRVFFPYNFIMVLIFGSLAAFGTIPMMIVGGVIQTNVIEYGEWKTGKRIVGMSNSAWGFGNKIATGLGAALIGWILAIGAYDGAADVQSTSAINSILVICFWLPLFILALCYILMRFYDLDGKYPQIIKELEERRGKTI